MRSQNTLRDWSRSEQVALRSFGTSAGWLLKFFDHRSHFFSVAFPRDPDEADSAVPTPNSASFLIGLAVKRNKGLLTASELGGESAKLTAHVAEMDADIRQRSAADLLPFKSFGPLPLFSTSFVAEYLPFCLDDAELNESLAYALAMRRLLAEFGASSESRGERSPPHAFVVSHAARAIRTLRDRTAQSKFPRIWDARALWDDLHAENLSKEVSLKKWWNTAMASEAALELFKDDRNLDEIIKAALRNARALSRQAVMTEISNQQRATSTIPDAAALAFGLLTLSEGQSSRHDELILQGLDVLQSMQANGLFPFGRPFFSDTRGRSLLVTSVEIATAALKVAMNPRLDLSEELLDRVEDATGEVQKRLIADHNEVDQVEGWCSDRAAIEDRVESWVTAHAMSFFANRVRFLRLRKRLFVFSQFSIESPESVKPNWDDLPDPDIKHCSSSLKKKIQGTGNPTFLLYGPPGTSKTTVAKAAATMSNNVRQIVMLSPSDFVQDSLERIEYRSREVFDQLMNIEDAVVIFDEIDTLFRDRAILRNKAAGSILEFVVPALLPKLQDFRNYAKRRNVTIFFLTNFIELIDSAISRAGRIDGQVIVLPYSRDARESVATKIFEGHEGSDKNTLQLLLSALRELPCTLVYQDINALVIDVIDKGFDEGRFKKNAFGRGVSPEVYDPEDRRGSIKEFCMFASRAFQDEYPEKGFDDLEAQIEFLKALTVTYKEKLSKEWLRVVEAWLQKLQNPSTPPR